MDGLEVNNVSTGVVDSQIENPIQDNNVEVDTNNVDGVIDGQNGQGEQIDTQQVEPPITENTQIEQQPQSPEMNAQFARVRREAEERASQKARDELIAELGWTYGDKPITTYAEYQNALKEQKLAEEAKNQGIDPQFYVEFKQMQEKSAMYERNEMIRSQEAELSADPVRGDLYGQWADDVKAMANDFNVDLKTAFTITLESKLPEIMQMYSQKAQNKAVESITQNNNASTGSLGQTAETPSLDFNNMTKEEFEAYTQRALRGELKKY